MPRIPRAIYEVMVAHALADAKNEVCGIIHARDGKAFAVHLVDNVATTDEAGRPRGPSPFRYYMAPMQQSRLEQIRDRTGETLFAIYHSHVNSAAYPSQTDRRQAFFPPAKDDDDFDREPAYPGVYYIVISLAHEEPEVKAFRILRGNVVEPDDIEVI